MEHLTHLQQFLPSDVGGGTENLQYLVRSSAETFDFHLESGIRATEKCN